MFTATLTLILQDINDNFPTFDDKNYTFSVSENAVDNSIITTIRATDKDVNRTISYDLIQGQYPTSSFKIGRTNGRYQCFLSMVSILPKLIFWCLRSSLAGWAEENNSVASASAGQEPFVLANDSSSCVTRFLSSPFACGKAVLL